MVKMDCLYKTMMMIEMLWYVVINYGMDQLGRLR